MGKDYIKTRQGTFPITVFEKDMYDVNLPKYLYLITGQFLKRYKNDLEFI